MKMMTRLKISRQLEGASMAFSSPANQIFPLMKDRSKLRQQVYLYPGGRHRIFRVSAGIDGISRILANRSMIYLESR
jgi:hypothetical protein